MINTSFNVDTELVDQEIARLRAIDNEREKVHKHKMKGVFTFNDKHICGRC